MMEQVLQGTENDEFLNASSQKGFGWSVAELFHSLSGSLGEVWV